MEAERRYESGSIGEWRPQPESVSKLSDSKAAACYISAPYPV